MQWTERLKAMRISKWAILVLAIAIVIFTVVTIYGANIGNFIISVKDQNDRGDVKLLLSQYQDYSAASPVISAQGLREQADTTKSAIPKESELVKNVGPHNDEIFKRYMAFSFFLINRSEGMIDYNYTFDIKSDSSFLYEVMRVWIIESDVSGNISNNTIYAYHETEENEAKYRANIGPEYYETTDYVNQTQIAKQQRKNFAVDDVVKFTVVIWLEGHDPLCTNELIGATLKCSMDFAAVLD